MQSPQPMRVTRLQEEEEEERAASLQQTNIPTEEVKIRRMFLKISHTSLFNDMILLFHPLIFKAFRRQSDMVTNKIQTE